MILKSIFFVPFMNYFLQAVDDSKIFDKVYYYMHILLEKDEIFQAKLHIRMRCLKPTNTIWLNAVNLSILTDSVSMSTMKSRRLQIVQFLDDEPNQLIGLKFDENLTTRVDYSLKFNNFSGIISQKSRHFGLFRNIHFSQNSTLATQFQLNSARQVFPCFDQPDQKAIFWLKMTFDGRKFAALSNGRVDQRSKKNSWEETTTFQNTPLMSTYTFAFCLLPIDRFKNFTSDDGNVKFQIFYDKYTFSDPQVAIFMEFANFAYDFMRTFFAESRIAQPIKKLDFVILNEFPIFGMENWGLIFLDQSFLLKNEPIEQFNLISHEVVHQWIGNLVTNRNWSQLCIQEGLAEYMTRKLVEDAISKGELLGMSSKRLEFYSTERYLRAMNIETKNSQNGRKAIIQDYRTFDQAGDFCFGKSPLIFLSVEKVLGSRNFKKRLNAFVENFAYKNFDIHDLVGYFDDSESTNIEKFMKYEMIHGAFRIVNVYKNQTFWTLTPSVFDLPIPVQIRYLANQNNESYIIRNTTQISAPHRHKDDLIIVNAAAEHFYRVNYDLATWHRLSIYMKNWSDSLGILSLAKLLNDYCFFYGRFKNDSVLNGILLREMKENMAVILKNFHEASNFVFQNSFNCHAM